LVLSLIAVSLIDKNLGAVEAMAYLTAIEKESMPSIPPPQPPISKSILQPPPPSSMSDIPTNEAMGIRDMVND